MIITKQEVLDIISNKTAGNLLKCPDIGTFLFSILHWENDDDPRDIKLDDINKLEQQLVLEIDTLLTALEDKIIDSGDSI
jgi:hypothetical protein